MSNRRFITVFMLLCLGVLSGAMAASLDDRIDIARQRIEQGMRSGALTRHEARSLRDEVDKVRYAAARARADGHFDRRERERLEHEMTRLERHISELKHNDVQRPRY